MSYEKARAYTGLGNVAASGGRSTEAVALWRRADETHRGLDPATVAEARARFRSTTSGSAAPAEHESD